MTGSCFRPVVVLAAAFGIAATSDLRAIADDDFFSPLSPFVQQYCSDCHAEGSEEGGLAIDSLSHDLADEATFARWERIFDRVEQGEMPPSAADQPSVEIRNEFLADLRSPLIRAHQTSKGTVLRRLNRREYQNTLNDLFGTHLDLENRLPIDGRSHEFDNVGASLNVSMVQLQRYLESIDAVMDAAIAKTVDPPKPTLKVANYAETREGEKHIGTAWKQLEDGAVVFFRPLGYPTGMLRTANTRRPGRYRIKVTGYAYQSEQPITFAIGATTFQRGAERPTFAYQSLPPGDPTSVEVEAWIEANYMIDLTPWGIADHDGAIRKNGLDHYPGPGLAILNVELEGPLVDAFPSRGHKLLFDGLQREEIPPSNPSVKEKSWYVPAFKIHSDTPRKDAAKVLERVAVSAFRRPITDVDINRYLELFDAQMSEGADFEKSLRTATAAIFCSPDFLYIRESDGSLDDHELATRLSYFLTRTAPDRELLDAARRGELSREPDALLEHARRLFDSRHHQRFIIDFTDAWLNLRDIEFTAPDKKLYPEFDQFLQFSMLDETREFVGSLISDNEPARNVVQSDYAMLNNRLATHYGIEGVIGPEIRRVSLDPKGFRGGILSQASVLKVSANGTNTSPVVRGVWVLERILGIAPPPPPPGIPGVEPDIRGASTIRELLAKHRNLKNCQSCHALIDPPGFALESFDPIGGLRDRYRSLGSGDPIDIRVSGQRVRYRLGPAVDASGRLPDGRAFAGFRGFRNMLAENDRAIALTLVQKLATFATGREMGFSDREPLDGIVDRCSGSGYGVRDLIEQLVTSEIFRRK